MTRISKSEPRPYDNQLRTQQAEETKGRILDAAVRVMARGVATLSIPAVAREAGVSVPTIYRHFGTKQDLLAAVYPHVVQRSGLNSLVPPRTIDELWDGARAYFEHVEAYDDIARAAMASPAAAEVRQLSMRNRVKIFRRVADSIEPRLVEADRDRIARILVVLTASSSIRMWRDHLGMSVDEAAGDLEWLVRSAIAAASTEDSK